MGWRQPHLHFHFKNALLGDADLVPAESLEVGRTLASLGLAVKCPECFGHGVVDANTRPFLGTWHVKPCEWCGGSGYYTTITEAAHEHEGDSARPTGRA